MGSETELVDVFHEWIEVFMHGSMGSLIHHAKRQGLSVSQVATLLFISRHGMRGVSDIGSEMGVTSAAASQMLDRLVQQGLVMRSENPEDRRTKQIELTERGLEMLRETTEERRRWVTSLAESMSLEERKCVVSALRLLITHVGQLEGTRR